MDGQRQLELLAAGAISAALAYAARFLTGVETVAPVYDAEGIATGEVRVTINLGQSSTFIFAPRLEARL